MFNAQPLPSNALSDIDWAVRWAVLRRQAGDGAPRALETLTRSQGASLACVTAAHWAATQRKSLSEAIGAALTTQCLDAAASALAAEVLALEPWRRSEAMAHGPIALGVSKGRFALDVLSGKGAVAAQLVLDALTSAAVRDNSTAVLELEHARLPRDEAAVTMLQTLVTERIAAAQANLKSAEYPERLAAVTALAQYAPQTDALLEAALADPKPTLAVVAAQALARGHGHTMVQELDAQLAAPQANHARWVELAGVGRIDGCGQRLRWLATDATQPDSLRSVALRAFVNCDRALALEAAETSCPTFSVPMRVACVQAIGEIPRSARATAFVRRGLYEAASTVVEAAVRASPTVGLTERDLTPLLTHADSSVRLAAIEVLLPSGSRAAQAAAIQCLSSQPPEQRAACATALEACSSAPCLGALATAAASDEDSRVKLAAEAVLRRLRPSSRR